MNAPELDDAQKAAYVWLVTAALWGRFRKQAEPERLLLMDGEEVSENPGGALRNVTAFFGLPLEESRVGEILADPVLNHHSKFPGQAYDAAQRREDRADWETRLGSDADRAMEWAAPIQEKLESEGIDLSAMAGAEIKEFAL
ncbi:MAG: sulfotransferase domain-containing protein [Acidobacteriota bacterium]|nr:sulfotransferase domain-containing protein [Acidobacteriota bacterium]